jgi:hypothetical protein
MGAPDTPSAGPGSASCGSMMGGHRLPRSKHPPYRCRWSGGIAARPPRRGSLSTSSSLTTLPSSSYTQPYQLVFHLYLSFSCFLIDGLKSTCDSIDFSQTRRVPVLLVSYSGCQRIPSFRNASFQPDICSSEWGRTMIMIRCALTFAPEGKTATAESSRSTTRKSSAMIGLRSAVSWLPALNS